LLLDDETPLRVKSNLMGLGSVATTLSWIILVHTAWPSNKRLPIISLKMQFQLKMLLILAVAMERNQK